MNENYRLVKPIETEYEWNKGPQPSGYVKIKVRLCPASGSAEGLGTITIHANLEKIGKIREYPYRQRPPEDELQKYIPKSTQMVMSGIQI